MTATLVPQTYVILQPDCSHTPVNTDDGNACTADACNTSTGAITHTDTTVDDGNACTSDVCDTSTGLITHTDP